jgi:glycosyltransferase involved in cell wall biosynthesis
MHIVHVTGLISLKYGGLEKFFLTLARECISRGHRFTCIWGETPASKQFLTDFEATGAKSIVISANNRWFAFVFELTGWLKREHCDLLHTHFNPAAILALTAAKLAHVPLTFNTIHSGFTPEEIARPGIRCKLSVKMRCYLSNRVLTVSEMVRKQFLTLGLDEKKSIVHYLGVPAANCSMSREQMRHQIGIKDDEFVIVCVAFHSPIKGVDILLKALKTISREFAKIKLVQVGGSLFPQETEELRMLSDELGLKERVIWLGQRDDVLTILQCGDIYCQPSRSEGLPLAILEAMSVGLPVVAANVGGIPEAVENNITGILVEPESIQELADALKTLIYDRQKRNEMGLCGKRQVAGCFEITRQNKKLVDMYECLVKK